MSAQGASIRNGHKAAIREENEKAILEAAEEVFAEYGFSGATTSRIAERAGIPKANLHYYFPTKEDIGAYVEIFGQGQVLVNSFNAELARI